MNNEGRELSWNDTITADNEYIALPEGDYDFMVESFERGRFEGSDKMPACNKAIVKIRVFAATGSYVSVTSTFLLHSRAEWKLSEFFSSIGQKKKGQPLQMNWNLVPGSSGKCQVGLREYKGNTYNEIRKFYPQEEVQPTSPSGFSQPAPGGFVPGQF